MLSHAHHPVTASRTLLVAPDAAVRLAAATEWLAAQPADAEVLLIGPTWEAVDDLARGAVGAGGARFGTTRTTLDRLAAQLAPATLVGTGRAPATALSLAAVVARATHRLRATLGYFAPVADRPGFPLSERPELTRQLVRSVATRPVPAAAGGGSRNAASPRPRVAARLIPKAGNLSQSAPRDDRKATAW